MLTQFQTQRIALITLSLPEGYYVMRVSGELAFYEDENEIFTQQKMTYFEFYKKIDNYLRNKDVGIEWGVTHSYLVELALQEYELMNNTQPKQAGDY